MKKILKFIVSSFFLLYFLFVLFLTGFCYIFDYNVVKSDWGFVVVCFIASISAALLRKDND